MKKIISLISFTTFISLFIFSCKKGPGEGGRASIKGKVYAVNYDNQFTAPEDSGYIGSANVYIIYGEENSVGDNQDTDNNGAFEFKYLRKGKYKVYVYTKTSEYGLDSAIVQSVEIINKKQIIHLYFKIKTNRR